MDGGSEKRQLVLLPGMLCDRELWRHQLAHLADVAEARVGDLTRDDSVAGMARHVLAAAPARFDLAGLSLGGIVALEILRREPARVTGLALLNTTARPPRPEQLDEWCAHASLVEGGRFGEFVEREWVPAVAGSDVTAAVAARSMALRVGPQAFLLQLAAQAGRADSRDMLPQIACPTLVLAGRQDAIAPVELHEEIASAVPGAALVVVDECGHLSSVEHPHAVTSALRDWLRES